MDDSLPSGNGASGVQPDEDDERWMRELSQATGLVPARRAPVTPHPEPTAVPAAPPGADPARSAPPRGSDPEPVASAPAPETPARLAAAPAADEALDAVLRELRVQMHLVSLRQERSATELVDSVVTSVREALAAQPSTSPTDAGLQSTAERHDRRADDMVEALVALRTAQVDARGEVAELRRELASLSTSLRTTEGADRLDEIELAIAAVYRAVRGQANRTRE